MFCPNDPASDLSRTWLLLRIKKLAPRCTRAPSVPEQQVRVPPLSTKSVAFPPLVPNLMGADSAVWLSLGNATVTLEVPVLPDTEAVTAKVCGLGKVVGAVYFPLLSMVPTVELPPCTPFTLQVALVATPLFVALNC